MRKLDAVNVCIGCECPFFKGKSGSEADPASEENKGSPVDSQCDDFKEMLGQLLEGDDLEFFTGEKTKANLAWTFFRSADFYAKVQREVMQVSACSGMLIMSSTGCPNAVVAALNQGLADVFFLCGESSQASDLSWEEGIALDLVGGGTKEGQHFGSQQTACQTISADRFAVHIHFQEPEKCSSILGCCPKIPG